jgi:beta-glucanase (GH16 family)/Ca2+-binding EF-hand superfamily protein
MSAGSSPVPPEIALMKTLLPCLLFGLLAVPAKAAVPEDQLPPAPEAKAWKLVWHDEFDGTKLDESKWDVPNNRRRDGWWSPKAVSLDGKGHLAISTLKDGNRYLDACVRTRGKFEHAHGYYVARVKLQGQPGHWSAFWLYNSSVGKIGNEGRDGTEIDIMEKPWLDDQVQHALHWDGYGKAHKSEGKVSSVPGVMDGFHTFSLWWKADEYVFYVDGKETWRTDAGGVCQVPLYIKLSDEIGKWGGDITKAKLPDRFLVDYVRVYDLVDAEKGQTLGKKTPLQILVMLGAKGETAVRPDKLEEYRRIFGFIDANGDGNLSTKEFVEDGRYMTRQARQGIFRASDANSDRVVSEKEYVTNRIITDEAKAIMAKMDADGNGKVARAEFVGHSGLPEDLSKAVFNEFDMDGNGELLIPEYLRVWGRWARSKGSEQ